MGLQNERVSARGAITDRQPPKLKADFIMFSDGVHTPDRGYKGSFKAQKKHFKEVPPRRLHRAQSSLLTNAYVRQKLESKKKSGRLHSQDPIELHLGL